MRTVQPISETKRFVANPERPNVARKRINWRAQASAWLFLVPAVLIFATFAWYPIITTIGYSFQKVSLVGESTWVGLANYRRMFGDPLFFKSWRNITEFAILSMLLGYLVPVMLALLVYEMRRLRATFQMIFYLPMLIPSTVALLIWRQIYAPEGGLLNGMIAKLGIAPQLWLQNPSLAKISMILILTWSGVGGTILIYVAGLQELPIDIYEAAELDGFSPWQRVRYIALPNLAPKMQTLLVLQIIFVVQTFTEPFLLTEGGPANTTLTPVLSIYRTAFTRNDYGLASAWSVSLLVVLSLFSLVYVWVSYRQKD